jgi:DNA mismatch repair protein MutL
MSDKIRLLPDTVASQIAAGEVVNRPASVVKEMMENSVDAGATTVTVSYRNGGKELIRVVDDGEGMSPLDARMAFDKHATSKITRIEDVYALHTFGFRGEALASIAAIAHVELSTRRREDELGVKIVVEGSRFQSQETVVTPAGSQFAVKNLFFNVPARRRALDKSTTEPRHIAEEFRRVAMCHPEMAFALYGEDAPVYNLTPGGLKQRIVGLMGKHIAGNLLEVGTETSLVKITGFVGKPSSSKQTNREQYMYVNGRFFKSSYFHKAVMQAYEKLIPVGTQPSYFLFFEVDPDKIDVNIHPQKIEVRFDDGPAIWQIIHASVRESLAKTGAVSFMDFDEAGSVEIPLRKEGPIDRIPPAVSDPTYNPFRCEEVGRCSQAGFSDFEEGYGTLAGMDRDRLLERFDSSVLEYIGGEAPRQQALAFGERPEEEKFCGALALGGGYAASSCGGELVVVDLRRAKEAILFERYRMMLGNDTSVTQKLMFPEVLVFSADDAALLAERYEDFLALGFEYVRRDENSIEVTGIPADFAIGEIQDLLYDVLDALADGMQPGDEGKDRLAAVLARDGAKRMPASYSEGEMTAILEALSDGGRYNYTYDGRPVLVRMATDEIKKLFSR